MYTNNDSENNLNFDSSINYNHVPLISRESSENMFIRENSNEGFGERFVLNDKINLEEDRESNFKGRYKSRILENKIDKEERNENLECNYK